MKVAKDKVATMVAEKKKGLIHKYGVTVYLDGWDKSSVDQCDVGVYKWRGLSLFGQNY